jgi:uncharacterized protein (TIGR00730 family)
VSLGSVAVFCGSSHGTDPAYGEAARLVGTTLAQRGVRLVYGGGRVGLMGVVADAALQAGGEVVGVIPGGLFAGEVAHLGLSALHEVGSMHERKQLMADLSDAFLVLPGGAGTLDEVAEQWTWAQIGIHDKPSGFLDVQGFWEPLRALREQMVRAGFVRPEAAGIVTFDADLQRLLERLEDPARKV